MHKANSAKLYSKLGLLLTSLFLLLLINACGGGSTTPTPSLTVSPTTATVTVGDAAIAFTATLSNSSSAINWSLTGAGSIPSGASGSTVSYTPPTTGGAATATLTATAGSLTASAAITINAQVSTTITVAGKVVNFDGSAATGVNVQIDDADATTGTATTDGTGAFSIAGVKTPYTLSVVPAAGTSAPQSWTDVTRADPTVVVTPLTGPANCATPPANGTLTVNWASPVGAGNNAQIIYVAPGINNFELVSNVQSTVAAGATTTTIPVTYDPTICDTSVTGKVFYIEFDGSNNIVRTGSVDATVLTGNTTTVTITQLTASTKTVSGTVTFPAGTATTNVSLIGKSGGASFVFFFPAQALTPAAPTYQFAAPEIPGLQLYTVALTGGIGGTAQWRWSDAISTLPATANLSLPNLGATNLPAGAIGANTTPTFTYTQVAGANLYTTFLVNTNAALTQWVGSTSSTSLKIPALPAPARITAGTAATPNSFNWIYSGIQVRAGGDSDTMLDGRQVKKVYTGLFSVLNPDIISAGSINNTPTTFTLP